MNGCQPIDYHALKDYYRARVRNQGSPPMNDYSQGHKCPDTSSWKTGDEDDTEYHQADGAVKAVSIS